MNMKIGDITIKRNGYVYIEVYVPKKMGGGTRFDGTKYKPYTYDELYRIETNGKKLYVEYYCIKDGWIGYPNEKYDIVKRWWRLNKNKIGYDTIKIIQGVVKIK